MSAAPERSGDSVRELCKRLGADRGCIVRASSADEVLDAIVTPLQVARSLGGSPIRVEPIRALAREAHEAGRLLACDNSLATSAHCAAAQLGADIVVEALDAVLGEGCGLVAVCTRADADVDLSGLERASEGDFDGLGEALDALDARMRAASDAAQVFASYLSCHPGVRSVAYPGLKGDPSFQIAASTLHHGFGPFVDFRVPGGRWQRASAMGISARDLIAQFEGGNLIPS